MVATTSADYTAVDPVFGTLADFDRLVEECHRRGIRLILDLVMNHTSSLHPWFSQSRQSASGPFADFYLWRDPSGWDQDGAPEPPNNWVSWFGGSAWEWEPPPAVLPAHVPARAARRELALPGRRARRCGRWSGAGSTGASTASGSTSSTRSSRQPTCPRTRSGRAAAGVIPGQEHRYDKDQPELLELLAEFRAIVDARPGPPRSASCSRGPSRRPCVHRGAPPRLRLVRLDPTPWRRGPSPGPWPPGRPPGADRWPTIVLSNHDHSRSASRYDGSGRRRAGQGRGRRCCSPCAGRPFLYYGEEIGLRDVDIPRDEIQDPAARRSRGLVEPRPGPRADALGGRAERGLQHRPALAPDESRGCRPATSAASSMTRIDPGPLPPPDLAAPIEPGVHDGELIRGACHRRRNRLRLSAPGPDRAPARPRSSCSGSAGRDVPIVLPPSPSGRPWRTALSTHDPLPAGGGAGPSSAPRGVILVDD